WTMFSSCRGCQADRKIQFLDRAAILTGVRLFLQPLADFQIHDSLQRLQARLNERLTSATEEQGAIQMRVAFKNRQHKSKALQGRQLKDRGDFTRYSLQATAVRDLSRFSYGGMQTLACTFASRRAHSNRVLDNHAARPRPRPFPEDLIACDAIVQARHE